MDLFRYSPKDRIISLIEGGIPKRLVILIILVLVTPKDLANSDLLVR